MAGKWKHGWQPLNLAAAIQKAHGSRHGAARALSVSHVIRKSPKGGLRARTTGVRGSSKGVGMRKAAQARWRSR
jgi:hypothetical protein